MGRVLITTSRRPSPRTRSLVKDLVGVIPGAVRITRGHLSMEELAIEARAHNADRVIIVSSRRGNPSLLRFYRFRGGSLVNVASLRILGVSLSREQRTRSEIQSKPSRILVSQETPSEEASIVGEALLIGLGAGVASSRGKENAVIIVLSDAPKGGVYAVFTYRGSRIGPRLRLAPTREPIKQVGEGE